MMRIGVLYRWTGFAIGGSGVVVGLLFAANTASGKPRIDEDFDPGVYYLNLYQKVEDCSMYRSLYRGATTDIARFEGELSELKHEIKQARSNFEKCAKTNGLVDPWRDEQTEIQSAEVCRDEFYALLNPGYRVRMIKVDLSDAEQASNQLRELLRWHCSERFEVAPVSSHAN